MLVSIDNISKKFGEKKLLTDVSLVVNEKDKIGIIGVNGCGKTTLLKIITNMESPDQGTVVRNWKNIAYLSQNPQLDDNLTVLEQTIKGLSENHIKTRSYEAKAILSKLKITEFDQKIAYLSGGQKRRVALACVLLNPCDLLILDEPTNHLDNAMIMWLEKFLNKYNKALLLITHDRYFLNSIVNKIIEIDQQKIYEYSANYAQFLELKATRAAAEAATMRKLTAIFNQEAKWMAQGVKARGTKSVERKKRFEQLQKALISESQQRLKLGFLASRLGTKTLDIIDISKSYQQKTLISNFSYVATPTDRIGIVGPNGCGKSTLLNLLQQKILPDHGQVVVGETVKIGVFAQEMPDIDPEQRVLNYVTSEREQIDTIDGTISATQLLEQFLFLPAQQHNKIKYLSGGEKRRLYLLKVLMGQPNILFLDEPTNDLDIITLTIFEEYLDHFPGVIFVVSHDRYFLDKVVDKLLVFNGDGQLTFYNDSYSDYLKTITSLAKKIKTKTVAGPVKINKPVVDQLKFSYKEKCEFATIDQDVETLEQKISALDQLIAQNANDFVKLKQHLEKRQLLEEALNDKMQRWYYLHDLAEKINGDKQIAKK